MSVPEQTLPQRPRVFISYSHDSGAHCDRVPALAQQLRSDGIEAELDQFHQEELLHWPRWCEEQLRPERSEFVLCICTPEYKRHIEGRVPADVGKGVFWEGTLIYTYLYDGKGNRRCLPVVLDKNTQDIPSILGGYTRFAVEVFGLENLQSEYSKLYHLLTKQSAIRATAVGELQPLPPLPEKERQTEFTGLIEEIRGKVAHIEQVSVETKADTSEILNLLRHTMPPASVPERPRNLPPWMSPDYFIGRGAEIERLMSGLTTCARNPIPQPQIIYGGGGTGKSRLAIQVAWLLYLKEKCDMAFFVSADTPATLDTKLAELDGESFLNLYKGADPPKELDARKEKVINTLRAEAGRWVLVLDNADSNEALDAVKQLLSRLAGGRFLVTSRRENWPTATVGKLRLDVFNPGEAVSCLRSRYWKTDPTEEEQADFKRLAAELGYLPLGLTLASSYMQSNTFTPGRYLEKWEQEQQRLLNFVGDDDERSTIGAFEVSYEQLGSAAAVLLQHLAWIAPAPFPRRSVEDSQYLSNALTGDISEALAELQALSLVERDENSISVHKLVLACVRALMSEETRRDSISSVLEWLVTILPMDEYEPEGWKLWVGLSPHLDSVIETSAALQTEGRPLAMISGKYGLWHYFQARFGLAEPLMRRALEIDQNSYGPQHPKVAIDLNNLVTLLHNTNRLSEAESLLAQSLVILLKFYQSTGHMHPYPQDTFRNYVGLLMKTHNDHETFARLRTLGNAANLDPDDYRKVLDQVLS